MLRIALYNIIFMYRYIVCRWLNIRNWLGVEFVSLNIHLFRLLFQQKCTEKNETIFIICGYFCSISSDRCVFEWDIIAVAAAAAAPSNRATLFIIFV